MSRPEDWRINCSDYNELLPQPAPPAGPKSFTFTNRSQVPVRLQYLQEGMWRPVEMLPLQPGETREQTQVHLTTQGRYRVVGMDTRVLDEIQIHSDRQTILWSPTLPTQPVICHDGVKEMAVGLLLAFTVAFLLAAALPIDN